MSISIQESLHYFAELPETYHDSHKRFEHIRNSSWEDAQNSNCIDRLLARPESSSWKSVRRLVKTARRLEVAGEFFADLSHVFDKIVRNSLSTGKDHDSVRMGSAVLAKYLAGLVTYGTFGAPKLIGAGFYFLSTAASLLALGLRQLEKKNHYPDAERKYTMLLEKGPVRSVRKRTQCRKDKILLAVHHWTDSDRSMKVRRAGDCMLRMLSRQSRPVNRHGTHLTHSAYMYAHLDLYKPRTRWMLKLSKTGFNVANKLLASPDKYVAYLLGTKILAHLTGEILGNRIAFTLCSAGAFLAGFFAAPVMLTILHVAAFAALASWGVYTLAKLDISLNQTWRGYA